MNELHTPNPIPEPIFTAEELAGRIKLHASTVRKLFVDQPGVIRIGHPTSRGRRQYFTDSCQRCKASFRQSDRGGTPLTGPPAVRPDQLPGTNPADGTLLPKRRYDVRSAAGKRLLFTVTAEHAAFGIAEGVFVLAHARSGAYLKRTADRENARQAWPSVNYTRPMRADSSCKTYQSGQLMGDPKRLREFVPVR
jgi:hypothetical protein